MATSDHLRDRLNCMLLETKTGPDEACPRPLIEVVHDEEGVGDDHGGRGSAQQKQRPAAKSTELDRGGGGGDGDDEPPPIDFSGASVTQTSDDPAVPSGGTAENTSRGDNSNDAAPSLAEQLLADAVEAKREEQTQTLSKERRRAKTSTFGLKKGFLNASSSSCNNGKMKGSVTSLKSEKKKGENVRNVFFRSVHQYLSVSFTSSTNIARNTMHYKHRTMLT